MNRMLNVSGAALALFFATSAGATAIPTNGVISTIDETGFTPNEWINGWTSAGGNKQKNFGTFGWEIENMGFTGPSSFSFVGTLNVSIPRVQRQIDFPTFTWSSNKAYRLIIRQKAKVQLAYRDANVNDGTAHYEGKMIAQLYCIGFMMPETLKGSKIVDEASESVVPAETSAVKQNGPLRDMEVTLIYDFPAGQKCVDGLLVRTQGRGFQVQLAPLELSVLEMGDPL